MPASDSIVNPSIANEPIVVGDRELIATRIFDAPRHLVWRAFTDPDHLKHWWGPNGFTNTFHVFDLKVGGLWRFTMHGPDGTNFENESRFVEIDWLSKIVLDHICEPHFRLTVQFEDLELKTKLSWHMRFEKDEVFQAVKPVAVPGLEQNLYRLGAHLPQIDPMRRELTIVRSFAAPRALVWQAWTDPKHLAKWWGPDGFANPVCEVDLRVGGALKILMRARDGKEYPMGGVFKEIVAPEKLVFTNAPVNQKGEPLIDGVTRVTFVERDGKTEMTLHTRAVGLAPEAGFMITGMGAGWSMGIDHLAAFLEGQ
jgi:uncharacterized protein YndB with AHSA1/START domain